MVIKMKAWIKSGCIRLQEKKYNRMLRQRTVSYDAWIREKEASFLKRQPDRETGARTVRTVPYGSFSAFFNPVNLRTEEAEICFFLLAEGEPSEEAEAFLTAFFDENPGIDLVYGDEDVQSAGGERVSPWCKPDWSPDTFLSFFYFGSAFAARTSALQALTEEEICLSEERQEETEISAYRICRLLAEKSGGFTRRRAGVFPVGHIGEILFHATYDRDTAAVKCQNAADGLPEREEKISVIIPSKDNAKMLMRCIESIERTAHTPYEILVVDNGSREETKSCLEEYLERKHISYLYDRQPFNFSAMCNKGAAASKGKVLLFLNDDVEAVSDGWLESLCRQALIPYCGAAGVKLLYPGSAKIQHAGIVNLRLGPVHKLQFMEDNICYYYGWNRGKHNVIAVTGACLAVERGKFLEAGGFPETLPVAFNDVDLCFSLFEKGYYNTVLQDVCLYHHESVSRGQDGDRKKLERLLSEKRRLYERHPGLYASDPFYGRRLARNILSSGFLPGSEDVEGKELLPSVPRQVKRQVEKAREDGCVMISLEYADTLCLWETGTEEGSGPKNRDEIYYLQGYAFVAGSNNACYDKKILLEPEKENSGESHGDRTIYALTPEIFRRRDVETNLPDQRGVGLTGFAVKFCGKELDKGSYRIGVLVKDKCSGQRLYAWTNRYLTIG